MNLTKYSALSFLLVGVLAAQTPPAPATGLGKVTYFDSETIGNGPRPDGAVYTFVDSADPSVAEIAQFGYKAIDRIGGQLVSEVTRELAAKEPRLAVSVMHLKQLELPKPVPGQPTITAIKRTSLLIRNPANTPDGADQAALNKIHKQLMADESVDKMLVQKIEHLMHVALDQIDASGAAEAKSRGDMRRVDQLVYGEHLVARATCVRPAFEELQEVWIRLTAVELLALIRLLVLAPGGAPAASALEALVFGPRAPR